MIDRLARVQGSFVDATLRWRHSDLLFTAPLAGREAFVYVLIEHQSGPDALMPFRMLRYVVRIWDQYLRAHPEANRLPAVIPLVVHHNRRPWSDPTDMWELIDLDPAGADSVAEYLPRFRFLLDDLAVLDEQALRARPLTPAARVSLLLLKIAPGNTRLADELRRWIDELQAVLQQPAGLEDLVSFLTYIENVGETPASELHDLFTQLGPAAGPRRWCSC